MQRCSECLGQTLIMLTELDNPATRVVNNSNQKGRLYVGDRLLMVKVQFHLAEWSRGSSILYKLQEERMPHFKAYPPAQL